MNESAAPDRAGRSRDAPRLRWEPLVHLVYLFNLFFQPLFDPAPTLLVWLSIPVSIAVFLPLYVRGVSAPPAGRIRAALAVTAVGLVTSFVNTGAAVYYVYAAALFGTALRGARLRWALAGLALLLVVQGLAVTTLVFRSPYPGISFVFCLVFVLVVGALTWSDAERERAHARLRLAQDEAERLARIAERERIARDLHDLLGHSLSVVVLKAELASKLADRDPQRAAREIRDVERIARQALTEVRSAVSGYRAAGLAGELANARLALEAAGVEASISVDTERLDPEREGVLALALREAVTNVVRHARATTCAVTLETSGGRALLTVTDDGVGGSAPEGAGLAGMRERLSAIGGVLERDGTGGTTLRVAVPLPLAAGAGPTADGERPAGGEKPERGERPGSGERPVRGERPAPDAAPADSHGELPAREGAA